MKKQLDSGKPAHTGTELATHVPVSKFVMRGNLCPNSRVQWELIQASSALSATL